MRVHRIDIVVGAGLAFASAVFAVVTFGRLNFDALLARDNVWFDSDAHRIILGNGSLDSEYHRRTEVHPLWGILASLPLNGLRVLGLGPRELSALLVAVGAAALGGLFYAAARAIGLDRVAAVLTTALLFSTSAYVFWVGIPDTFTPGAATMLVPIVWLGATRGRHDRWSAPLQSLISVSVTLTNWMAGLFAALIGLDLRRAARATMYAFLVVSALTVVQTLIMPTSGRLFDVRAESEYVVGDDASTLPVHERVGALLVQPLVAPSPELAPDGLTDDSRTLVRFADLLPDVDVWLVVSVVGWIALLVMGLATSWGERSDLKLLLCMLTVTQVALHLLYAHVHFLYAIHYTPFLALLAGGACLGRLRRPALGVMAVTALATLLHNLPELSSAIDRVDDAAFQLGW